MAKERARLKVQREQEEKEEKERVSRAVAGVTHLDIPAELAFVFNKIDGKKFNITTKYILCNICVFFLIFFY